MDNASLVANCLTAKQIASDDGFMRLLIFRLSMFVLGLLMIAAMFYMEGRFLAYHPNARILLMANNVWILLQSLAYIALLSFDIHRFSQSLPNSCDYLVTAAASVAVRAPPDIAMYGQCWSMFFLALERSIATACYKQYEKTTNVLIGWFMLSVQIVLPFLWIFLMVFDFNWEILKVSCSLVNTKTQNRFLILMSSMAALEIFTVLWLLILYVLNNVRLKMMNSELSRHRLTEKYQICENMRAIAHVFPIIITHFIFFCGTLVAQPINTYLHANQSAYEFHVQIETLNFLPFYAFALPIVLFIRNRWEGIEEGLRRVLVKIKRPVPEEPDDGQIYFQQLSQQFDRAAMRAEPKRSEGTLSRFRRVLSNRRSHHV
ncbi:hypothetical protein QR680_008692 [Steinernema hermaphroditum]|uniref:G-protein coupled receptors family 1 profile domain-containing protein n=1 Tax=Steinernema hermaphroditum TaxID=289476 RepID=A0AA39M8J9_9BILA|nr:hypothetical protein QR680_008692 [Steinernema hermaphroditum]